MTKKHILKYILLGILSFCIILTSYILLRGYLGPEDEKAAVTSQELLDIGLYDVNNYGYILSSFK